MCGGSGKRENENVDGVVGELLGIEISKVVARRLDRLGSGGVTARGQEKGQGGKAHPRHTGGFFGSFLQELNLRTSGRVPKIPPLSL
jgi:hypothetical protein